MRLIPVILVVSLVACASDVGLPVSSGPVTTITAVTPTAAGYTLTIRVTNPDTGAIAYGPYCPGTVVERFGDEWRTVTGTAGVCRTSAQIVDAGGSRSFAFDEPNISRGGEIRFVFSWSWFNGAAPMEAQSVSAPVSVP